MAGTGERAEGWLRWENGYRLEIPKETFNTVDRDNAAALYDWRARDGYFYLIYAGKSSERRKAFRGTASRRPPRTTPSNSSAASDCIRDRFNF